MVNVVPITDRETLAIAHQIRHRVFVLEQNCPPEIEYEYEDESHHFLAWVGNAPAGTARWRVTSAGIKLERFAVLEEFRSMGIGKLLLKAVVNDCPRQGNKVYLHAQMTAKGFYEKYGFLAEGDTFWEADIEHVKMLLPESVMLY
ncbi:MAG: GNAT family N-acetyltransferase [Bacteroidota bacterium]|jgi:predicted GNAT family N-acyltransferase